MNTKRITLVKQLYFTIVTLVVLAMMLISGGYLIYTGLYAGVFTGDTVTKEYPPVPYIIDPGIESSSVACTDACELSDAQQTDVKIWLSEYQLWKDQEPSRIDRTGLVTALSFFIVSIPLFFIHFRLLRKEHKAAEAEENETTMFYVYYYIVALGTLIVAVVYAALLINATLRTWVITDTVQSQTTTVREVPYKDASLSVISSCTDQCGFTEDEQAAIQSYESDVNATDVYYSSEQSWQRRFSLDIAALLVTIPIFFYHWQIIRKKPKSKESN